MARRKRTDPLNDPRLLARSSRLVRSDVVFDDDDVRQLLKEAIKREGSQIAFARRHAINRTYLNQVLNYRRSLTDVVLKPIGLRKVYVAD